MCGYSLDEYFDLFSRYLHCVINTIKMEEKETNYFRFHRLCIRLGTKVVREKFNQILPPCDLPTKLAARRALVNSIRGMINQKQKDLLYPTSGTAVEIIFYILTPGTGCQEQTTYERGSNTERC